MAPSRRQLYLEPQHWESGGQVGRGCAQRKVGARTLSSSKKPALCPASLEQRGSSSAPPLTRLLQVSLGQALPAL